MQGCRKRFPCMTVFQACILKSVLEVMHKVVVLAEEILMLLCNHLSRSLL